MVWDTCGETKVYIYFLPLTEIRGWVVGLWSLSPWPTTRPCWWTCITALLCCPTASVYMGGGRSWSTRMEWPNPVYSKVSVHTCFTLV